MRRKHSKLGSSLLVPSVQELAKSSTLTDVPLRYIRDPPHDEEEQLLDDDDDYEVPIIDMEKLLSPQSMPCELSKLHFASTHWGFFQVHILITKLMLQLINHRVSSSVMGKMKREVEQFFKMTMEEKSKYWQSEEEVEGFGQAFVVSDEQKLDWADLFFIVTQPPNERNPHLFPNLPLPLRETLEEYSKELKITAMEMLVQMAKALKMDENEMKQVFEDGHQSMRMNYYPPCPQPNQVIGLTPHSDATGLTILLQLNQVEGLQIKKHGNWVSVKPLPNAFIINIGDIVEIITNGEYRSIEHRAMVNSEKERLSIATFYAPSYETEIGPAKSLMNKQNPPNFKRILVQDFFKGLFSRELNGKSYLDSLRV
ncbi:Protein SRG1 [Linum perenne]